MLILILDFYSNAYVSKIFLIIVTGRSKNQIQSCNLDLDLMVFYEYLLALKAAHKNRISSLVFCQQVLLDERSGVFNALRDSGCDGKSEAGLSLKESDDNLQMKSDQKDMNVIPWRIIVQFVLYCHPPLYLTLD